MEGETARAGRPQLHFDRFNRLVDDGWLATLPHALLKTYLVLERHANRQGEAHPGLQTIARLTGCSTRSATRNLSGLAARGLARQTRYASPGSCAVWLVAVPAGDDAGQNEAARTTDNGNTVDKNSADDGHPHVHPYSKNSKNNTNSEDGGDVSCVSMGDGVWDYLTGDPSGPRLSVLNRRLQEACGAWTVEECRQLWRRVVRERAAGRRQGAMADMVMREDKTLLAEKSVEKQAEKQEASSRKQEVAEPPAMELPADFEQKKLAGEALLAQWRRMRAG
jgi:hypothetical protein